MSEDRPNLGNSDEEFKFSEQSESNISRTSVEQIQLEKIIQSGDLRSLVRVANELPKSKCADQFFVSDEASNKALKLVQLGAQFLTFLNSKKLEEF